MIPFAGKEAGYFNLEQAQILLQSIPYDGTSTWKKGANKGFLRFLDACENMELYDIETDSEVYKKGIHILPSVKVKNSPQSMYEEIFNTTKEILKTNKFCTFFGGEHSITIGILDAYKNFYPKLNVLQIDAHADLRKEYLGSPYNHACALHKASYECNLVQVGIRSMDISEKKYLNSNKCFFAHQIYNNNLWMQKSIDLLKKEDPVYLTIDLDALDSSIMPSTGTPEPGGIDWYTLLSYLKKVFQQRNVIGFDLVEFAPIDNIFHADFLIAKLYYKLLSYKFYASK